MLEITLFKTIFLLDFLCLHIYCITVCCSLWGKKAFYSLSCAMHLLFSSAIKWMESLHFLRTFYTKLSEHFLFIWKNCLQWKIKSKISWNLIKGYMCWGLASYLRDFLSLEYQSGNITQIYIEIKFYKRLFHISISKWPLTFQKGWCFICLYCCSSLFCPWE